MDEDVVADLLHVAVAEREQVGEVVDRGGGEVDPVDAGPEVDDDIVLVLAACAEMIEDESVGTAAAGQGVVAVATLECIGAVVSLQKVRIIGADQILDVGYIADRSPAVGTEIWTILGPNLRTIVGEVHPNRRAN